VVLVISFVMNRRVCNSIKTCGVGGVV
jgi:hypothetical protein